MDKKFIFLSKYGESLITESNVVDRIFLISIALFFLELCTSLLIVFIAERS